MERISGFREYWSMLMTGLRLAWRKRPLSGHGHHEDVDDVDVVNAKQELRYNAIFYIPPVVFGERVQQSGSVFIHTDSRPEAPRVHNTGLLVLVYSSYQLIRKV